MEIDSTVMASIFPLHWSISDCCHRKNHSNAKGEFDTGNGSLCKDSADRANSVAEGLE